MRRIDGYLRVSRPQRSRIDRCQVRSYLHHIMYKYHHVLVHRSDPPRLPEEVVVRAPLLHHVLDQLALPVVRRQDGDLGGRVAQQPHVLVGGHDVLRLPEVLVEERRGSRLSPSLTKKKKKGKENGSIIQKNKRTLNYRGKLL